MSTTTITTQTEDSRREITTRTTKWDVTEPSTNVYVLTEYDSSESPYRATVFDEIVKFNARVYYLKFEGNVVARVDTIGSTQMTYTPIVHIANKT
jgi:uncharacterized protein YpmS